MAERQEEGGTGMRGQVFINQSSPTLCPTPQSTLCRKAAVLSAATHLSIQQVLVLDVPAAAAGTEWSGLQDGHSSALTESLVQ